MAKGNRGLHACDAQRKKDALKDKKRNAANRKQQREFVMRGKTSDELLSEIHRINRVLKDGEGEEDKLVVQKRKLIEAHKAAVKREKELAAARKNAVAEETVTIKGMGKIFKQTKSKSIANQSGNALEFDGSTQDEDDGGHRSHKTRKTEDADEEMAPGFTQEEEESMMFDDEIIEEVMLEVPPGIKAPPGIRGVPRPPGQFGPQFLAMGQGVLLGMGTSPVFPHQNVPMSSVPLGPSVPAGAPPSTAGPEVQRPGRQDISNDPMDPNFNKPGGSKEIGAQPKPAPSGPKLAFMPTSLMVRKRPAPVPVRRLPRKAAPAAAKPAAVKEKSTAEAYDKFMAEMENIGAFDE
mmetsp:Transcript_134/g.261  ORF Transcript_134/g.261 Transcript_134/m.261 type:complete len:350 (+) Transcript_134:58-1107(+)